MILPSTSNLRHVLLTGAGGFSGAYLLPRLLADGYRVTAVAGRRSLGRLPEELLAHPSLTVLRGDLAGDLPLPETVDAVIHAAGRSPGPGVGVADFVRDNVLTMLRLVRYARAGRAAKFIYFSSLSVFGRIGVETVDEATPILDPDAYGATKRLGEQILADEAADLSVLCLRLPGVIGPNSVRNWLSTLLAKACAGEPIEFFNPAARFNNAVHIDDLAGFLGSLLRQDWRGFDMLTLGADGEMTIGEVVSAVVAGTGSRSPVRVLDVARPSFVISSRKAIARYGYRPRSIQDIVERFSREDQHSVRRTRDH